MASQRYLEKIQQDQLAGQSYGVQGTPAFFINGYRFMGFNQEAVESLVNELLLIGEQR